MSQRLNPQRGQAGQAASKMNQPRMNTDGHGFFRPLSVFIRITILKSFRKLRKLFHHE